MLTRLAGIRSWNHTIIERGVFCQPVSALKEDILNIIYDC